MSDTRQIFSLKQVAASIKKTMEERYSQLYWVKAEMHKLNQYPSGHCFPELVQKEDDKIVAQMNASIWAHNFERINKNFIQIVKEPLKEGSTLLMQVKITFHEIYGLSLQLLDIDPNYALGELQRERQETLTRLQKEGILNANQKLHFPLLPKRIAVISADSSKGLSDFRMVMDNNPQGYRFFSHLFPAYLQGDVAVSSILAQLDKIKKVKHHFDVVVIVRGGGGEVGMSCYNNYQLCREIATFPLPVLTGIGHSTNLTVAEMVAFRNAITPTELADFLLASFQELDLYLRESSRQIISISKNKLTQTHTTLTSEVKMFRNVTSNRIAQIKNLLLRASSEMKNNVRLKITKEQENINNSQISIKRSVKELVSSKGSNFENIRERIGRTVQFSVRNEQTKIENLQQQLPGKVSRNIEKQQQKINTFEQTIRLVNPINVLKRGYAIALLDGKILSDTNPPTEGKALKLTTHLYELETEIKNIKPIKNEQ